MLPAQRSQAVELWLPCAQVAVLRQHFRPGAKEAAPYSISSLWPTFGGRKERFQAAHQPPRTVHRVMAGLEALVDRDPDPPCDCAAFSSVAAQKPTGMTWKAKVSLRVCNASVRRLPRCPI